MLSNFDIRHKLFLANLGILLPALMLCSFLAYTLLQRSIETHIESELKNTTAAILSLVRTSAAVSIKNHLRATAENNLHIATRHHELSRQGLMTESEARSRVAEIFLSQRIGQTGYIYCVNSAGTLMVHPDPSLKGTDISEHRFIQEQARRRSGYLEYQWKNPGESSVRPKALYMAYFKPWDWIISVSSYREEFRDLIHVDDFRQDILSLRFGTSGYSYVMDTTGTLVIHPKLQGANIGDFRNAEERMFIKEVLKKKSGKIVYLWKNPGETRAREKLVIFNHIPELDWIVASSSYLEEFYHPLAHLRTTVAAILLVSLILVLAVSWGLSANITGQLGQLMNRFEDGASGNFSTRIHRRSKDEIGRLAEYFNKFMAQFESHHASLKTEIRTREQAQQALAEAHGKLEQRVRDRTRELEAANRRLAAEMDDKHRAEKALREQVALIETVINTIPNPVFYKDSEGKYIGCNTAFAEQVLGIAPHQVIGRTPMEIIPRIPRDLAIIYRQKDEELIRRTGHQTYESPVLCADGIRRDFLFNKATFTDGNGKVSGIAGMMMDLTVHQEAERKRLEHEKLAGVLEMAGAICHELNQPLQTVSGHAHLLSLDLPPEHPAMDNVRKLRLQVERMGEITRKLMGITCYASKHYAKGVRIIDIDRASGAGHGMPIETEPPGQPSPKAG